MDGAKPFDPAPVRGGSHLLCRHEHREIDPFSVGEVWKDSDLEAVYQLVPDPGERRLHMEGQYTLEEILWNLVWQTLVFDEIQTLLLGDYRRGELLGRARRLAIVGPHPTVLTAGIGERLQVRDRDGVVFDSELVERSQRLDKVPRLAGLCGVVTGLGAACVHRTL